MAELADDLIKQNHTQVERLIDLYLSGGFDQNMLVERKTRLTETITK